MEDIYYVIKNGFFGGEEGIPDVPTYPFPTYINRTRNMLEIGEMDDDKWGVFQKQQRANEDRYQAKKIGPYRYYAIFDGHGGAQQMGYNHVGEYSVNNLHIRIAEKLIDVDLTNTIEVSEAIKQVFIDFDTEMYNLKMQYGTTCTILLIDDKNGYIYQINLGDSRSIIFRMEYPINMSTIISSTNDHEPELIEENRRITNAGGWVINNRVLGQLMVSRSFGDFHLKRNKSIVYDPINGMVSSIPDIKILAFSPIYKYNAIITSDAPYERNAFDDNDLIIMSTTLYNERCLPYDILVEKMGENIYPKTTDDTTIMYIEI